MDEAAMRAASEIAEEATRAVSDTDEAPELQGENAPSGSLVAGNGRYAPSPTGDFHLGNLRTALLAWAFAQRHGRGFVMRVEDLDVERSRSEYARSQLADLAAIGLTWNEPVQYQSERGNLYECEFERLREAGLLYECYCTRKDLAEAASAPNGTPGVYPGTCRDLSGEQRAQGRAKLAGMNRGPALRLRSSVRELEIRDEILGNYIGVVDDFVIRRGDGAFSYNFVSVVDDAEADIREVTRGADLLASTPRQVHLQHLLGFATPQYFHVPMVFNLEGRRLAKRDGAVTMRALASFGWTPADIVRLLAASLEVDLPEATGLTGSAETRELARIFSEELSMDHLRHGPWYVDTAELERGPRR
ncbi:glutamyl-queuosine tRNA(Asp) synthetase [Actinobaculum massiliense ACS-171-V-Col2]|uniref:Glutamyl-queuosine tRNA(Asp) synthetase n=1 Tax=Actinobaculum massiliense ACS-171-V-Col2 TaxID=883066 RepID=K9EEU2_9ACTO|nr:glutamyl-queuosine tRNA(Asp) synthetase [Actinobaculum massiliense ACS-171-V-Col2]